MKTKIFSSDLLEKIRDLPNSVKYDEVIQSEKLLHIFIFEHEDKFYKAEIDMCADEEIDVECIEMEQREVNVMEWFPIMGWFEVN